MEQATNSKMDAEFWLKAGVQVYLVEYQLAPEWQYPTQLDEYEAVLNWLRGDGKESEVLTPTLSLAAGIALLGT